MSRRRRGMSRRRRDMLALGALLPGLALLPLRVLADAQPKPLPAEVAALLPDLRLRGGGLFRYWGFQVYYAWLWTPGGAPYDPARPFALDIEYLRRFSEEVLAERSIEEMRAQGRGSEALYPHWLRQMRRVFRDVKPGDRLTGVATPARHARFYYNGALTGEIADPAFTDAFFAIWLSERTSQPRLRELLLGGR
ncbi:MAG: chalcone isomerase family protein [Casimicrobiaceae bacterium]|nr:chalcone isomerase family protein [Casimicrobiaceae bacterium]